MSLPGISGIAGALGRAPIAGTLTITRGEQDNGTDTIDGYSVDASIGSSAPTTLGGITMSFACTLTDDATGTDIRFVFGVMGDHRGAIFNSVTKKNGVTVENVLARSASLVPFGTFSAGFTSWQWAGPVTRWPSSGTRTLLIA